MYCSLHIDDETPAVSVETICKENLSKLRKNKVKHNKEVNVHEDQIFVIDGI